MKNFLIICALIFVNACVAQPKINDAASSNAECNISFEDLGECIYKSSNHDVTVNIVSENLAEDEALITKLAIKINGISQVLTITPDTTLLEGDVGYISFSDINFDGVPDLAITTSFGAPNLYLDYWVFNVLQGKYISIGNYPQFIINGEKKTLKSTIKNSANDYQTTEWRWNESKLEKL